MGQRPPLTPDFYHYPEASIATVEISINKDALAVSWSDGTQLSCYYLWLQENDVSNGRVDHATREGLIDPADLDVELTLSSAYVDPLGHLLVIWNNADTSRFHSGWLRHIAEGQHQPAAFLPQPSAWTAARLPAPPSHSVDHLFTSYENTAAWTLELLKYGVTKLTAAPTASGYLKHLAAQIGPVRDSNFGALWDVKSEPAFAGKNDTNSTANTSHRLGPHTDLPTRETPPGFQFLHCLCNEAEGGFSTLCDSLAIIDHLAQAAPDLLEALTTLQWIFFNRGPALDHRWSGPIIDYTPGSIIPTIRAFYPVKAFPNMDDNDIPRAYEALRHFQTLAADPRFQIRFQLEAGDILCFDNRRILHGRDAFNQAQTRHLQGIYIDRDEIYSLARVTQRRATATLINTRN